MKAPKKASDTPLWAARLKRARAAKFESASAFAAHIGLSQQRYAHYEDGKREPSYSVLVQICSALNVNPGYILTGIGEAILAARHFVS